MLFSVFLYFLTAEDFVGRGINGHQLTVRIGGIQAFCLRIQRQSGAERAGVRDGVLQLQRCAINNPDHALLADAGNVYRIGRVIGHQLARLKRLHRVATFAIVQHQAPFHLARFGVNRRHGTVDGVTEPQRLGGVIDRGAKRLEIVMNRLRHFQRDRIQTIDHAALIGFAAL